MSAARNPDELDDLLALDNQLCFALYAASRALMRTYRPLLEPLGLTYPQYLVMLVLWEKDGVNVSEICDRLFLETTTLTPLLKRLEARGLIKRTRSIEDERQVIVTLTGEGQELKATASHIPACVGEAMDCSLTEIADLRDRLNEVRASLFKSAS